MMTRSRSRRARAAAISSELYGVDNPLPLEDSCVYLLAVATNLNSSTWERRYARRYRMTLTDWRVLMLLVSRPGLCARELSDILAIDKMNITRSARRLLASKRIRASENPADRRRLDLAVTRRGASIYDAVAASAWRHQERLLQDLTPAEQLMLRELLGKVVTAGRRLASEPAAP